MPTTLFVLVNAVINAFRLVDHIVVMTRGGPDNATTLLLYYIYRDRLPVLGLGVRGGADDGAAGAARRSSAIVQFVVPRAADALPMSARMRPRPSTRRTASRARSRRSARGCSACCGCCRWSMRSGRRSIRRRISTHFTLARAADAREFRQGLARGAVRALFPQHRRCWSRWCSPRSSCSCTLAAYAFARFELPGPRRRVRAGAACS